MEDQDTWEEVGVYANIYLHRNGTITPQVLADGGIVLLVGVPSIPAGYIFIPRERREELIAALLYVVEVLANEEEVDA